MQSRETPRLPDSSTCREVCIPCTTQRPEGFPPTSGRSTSTTESGGSRQYWLIASLTTCHRFGLRTALNLGIIKPEATIVAVQGWKGGLGHVSRALKACCRMIAEHAFSDQHPPNPQRPNRCCRSRHPAHRPSPGGVNHHLVSFQSAFGHSAGTRRWVCAARIKEKLSDCFAATVHKSR